MFIFKAKEYQSEKSPIIDSQKSTKTTRKLHIMSPLYAAKVCQLFCNTRYVPRVEGEEGDAGVVPAAQHRVQLLLQGRRGLVQQHREAQPGGERVRLPAHGDLSTTAGGNYCHLKSARSWTISWPGGTTGMKMPFSSSLVQGMSEMATCMETWRGHTAWLLTADS